MGGGGCELSGDGCYGIPTDLPWGMAYPNGLVPTLDFVHPTPIYEMIQMVCIFGILLALRDRLRPGRIFGLYLVLMAVARLFCRVCASHARGFCGSHCASVGEHWSCGYGDLSHLYAPEKKFYPGMKR